MANREYTTLEKINYLLTGTEEPRFLTEREKVMINKFVTYLDEKVGWTDDKTKSLIQSIYAEFAELPSNRQSHVSLKKIIEIEVEQHPIIPIQIFVK